MSPCWVAVSNRKSTFHYRGGDSRQGVPWQKPCACNGHAVENDIHCSYFHTVSAEYLKASLNKDGLPASWLHRTVAPSITAFAPGMNHEAAFELGMGFTNMAYAIPNVRLENPEAWYTGWDGIARYRTFPTALRWEAMMNWRARLDRTR